MTPEDKSLQRLRQQYRLALERYIDLATAGSGRLTRLTPENISGVERANLSVMSRKEEAAYEAYVRAKIELTTWLMHPPTQTVAAPRLSGAQA